MSAESIRLYSGDPSGPPPTTIREVADAYLDEKRLQLSAGACCEKSVYRSTFYLDSFCAMFGTQPISACKRNDLVKWLVAHQEWESSFTRQDAVGVVVACFRWAEGEIIDRTPYRRPNFVGPPTRPRPALSLEEYRSLRGHARVYKTKRGKPRLTSVPFRAALSCLWRTGCRPCEMRAAEWDDLDPVADVVVLSEHKTANATGDERVIPVGPIMPLLRWLRRRRKPGQKKIFVNGHGKPWTCDRFAKEFRKFADLAGVRPEVSAYCLRHGLCVRLIEQGKSDRSIADVLGHTTTRYVSWYGRTTRTKAAHLNAVLRSDKKR